MFQNKSFLAIIPARGGSKRLHKKNIQDLADKPLIAWTIEAGLNSKYIDEVVVSTDDNEITKVSKQFGARVPFKRPNEISNDIAGKEAVIKHTLEYYKNKLSEEFDYIVYLQPTSPLRNSSHIDEAIDYMFSKSADAVVSVCEVDHPVQWSGTLPLNNDMCEFVKKIDASKRSQDLTAFYRLNGAIFMCDVQKFIEAGSMLLENRIFAFKMKKDVSVDIDTHADLLFAEFLIKEKYFNNHN